MWTLPDSIVKSKFDNFEFTPLHCDNRSNGTLPLNVCTTPLECAHLHKVNQELNSRFGGRNSVGDSLGSIHHQESVLPLSVHAGVAWLPLILWHYVTVTVTVTVVTTS